MASFSGRRGVPRGDGDAWRSQRDRPFCRKGYAASWDLPGDADAHGQKRGARHPQRAWARAGRRQALPPLRRGRRYLTWAGTPSRSGGITALFDGLRTRGVRLFRPLLLRSGCAGAYPLQAPTNIHSFASAVNSGLAYGVQFHPEKSGAQSAFGSSRATSRRSAKYENRPGRLAADPFCPLVSSGVSGVAAGVTV